MPYAVPSVSDKVAKGTKMLRLKYLITTCGLALTVSFGLSLACPSYSLAGTVTFDYSGNVLSYYAGDVTGYYSVAGSFSIDSSIFNGTANQVIDNSNISSAFFTVEVLKDLSPINGHPNPAVGTYTLNILLAGGSTTYNSTTTTPTLVDGSIFPDFLAIDSNSTPYNGLIIGANSGPGAAIVYFSFPQLPAPFNDNAILGTWTTIVSPSTTPLPAALPLFATGLGALGLLGWRRKRKAAAAIAAA
jgi:hypothetical protein